MNSLLVLTALIFSKAFVDYSTSGLENPLTYFLIVIFFFIYLKKKNSNRKILLLTLITSITALNRYDTILLLLPPLLYHAYKTEKLKSIRYIIAGIIPLISWLLFSLFYYGFPFPNTAYAKLNHGINSYELIEQGLYYFLNSFYLDPVTITLIFTGLALLFFLKMKSHYPTAIGIILYLIYIIKVGGDFMSGRFFSVPFLIGIIIVSQLEFKRSLYVTGLIFIIFLGLLAPYSTIFSSSTYGLGPKLIKGFRLGPTILITYDNGIADERLFYYQFTGLLNYQKLEKHQWVEKALKIKESKKTPGVYNIAGIFGFYAGPDIHIIDPWALGDPLLSKLPSTEYWRVGSSQQLGDKWWRVGHFTRKIPEGYIETIESGNNKIKDESLKKYYDKLSFVIKGNLFDAERLKEIININCGKYDYLIEEYEKRLFNDRKNISQ
jgi:arabinofuranosyltransferase